MTSIENRIIPKDTSLKEVSYEFALRKREFFKRISDKYSAHTKLLTNIKNFNHMLPEVHRINDYYKIVLDKLDDKDFDFDEYERNFDKLIEEDINTIENRYRN
jgi:hypothetical protein